MADASLVSPILGSAAALVAALWGARKGAVALRERRESRRVADRVSLDQIVSARMTDLMNRQKAEIDELRTQLAELGRAFDRQRDEWRRREEEWRTDAIAREAAQRAVEMERDNLRAQNALADQRHARDVERISALEQAYAQTRTDLEAKLADAHREVLALRQRINGAPE